MKMYNRLQEYLAQLKLELKGSDRALIQDALADSEEYLFLALEKAREEQPGFTEKEALNAIISKYGTPAEVASGYRDLEERLHTTARPIQRADARPLWARFFGILGVPRAWGSFLYELFSVLTGLLYFGWILVGGLFSLVSLLFIIGIPISAGFLLSLRGLALIEGGIIEALLGERMPRKPLFVRQELKWTGKLKSLYTEPQTWRSLLYLFLQFPLGLLYFCLIGGLFLFSLSLVAAPFMELVLHLPMEFVGNEAFTPVWLLPILCLLGILLFPLILHLARGVGNIHGRYAKAMLVRK
jgi:hypothetical protein